MYLESNDLRESRSYAAQSNHSSSMHAEQSVMLCRLSTWDERSEAPVCPNINLWSFTHASIFAQTHWMGAPSPGAKGACWVQPVSPWTPEQSLEMESSGSSVGSPTSEMPMPVARAPSTGLAELANLGSSPDSFTNPLMNARRGSDALSWSSALEEPPQGASAQGRVNRACVSLYRALLAN